MFSVWQLPRIAIAGSHKRVSGGCALAKRRAVPCGERPWRQKPTSHERRPARGADRLVPTSQDMGKGTGACGRPCPHAVTQPLRALRRRASNITSVIPAPSQSAPCKARSMTHSFPGRYASPLVRRERRGGPGYFTCPHPHKFSAVALFGSASGAKTAPK